MASTGIQGHHLFVQQLIRDYGDQFEDYLPGWQVHGEYNLAARAANSQIAAQLDKGMHLGSHRWLNNAIEAMLLDPEYLDAAEVDKPKMLGGLINVLFEAEDITGAKTNGFLCAIFSFGGVKDGEHGRHKFMPSLHATFALSGGGLGRCAACPMLYAVRQIFRRGTCSDVCRGMSFILHVPPVFAPAPQTRRLLAGRSSHQRRSGPARLSMCCGFFRGLAGGCQRGILPVGTRGVTWPCSACPCGVLKALGPGPDMPRFTSTHRHAPAL